MNSSTHPTIDLRLIDALVDGELDGPERTNLLRRIEQSPSAWRSLAITFLEAQAWRQALTPPAALPNLAESVPPAAFARKRSLGWLTVCALMAILAFSVGRFEIHSDSRTSAVAVVKNPPPVESQPARVASATTVPAALQSITPDVRRELERLGYRVQERPRVVTIQRPDGQSVQVLVNEVEVRYVGRPFRL